MCRMVAVASARALNARLWLRSLAEAAANDPLLQKLSGELSHGDGWGLAALSGDRLLHYRTARPMWEDGLLDALAAAIEAPLALVAHARKASKGTPLGVGAAHPFPLDTRSGGVLFVAQNGGVDVERVAPTIRGKPALDSVDSFVYAVALAEQLEGASLGEALVELHRRLEELGAVKGMANTFALLVEREGGSWRAELGVVRHVVRERLAEYGELFVASGPGFFAAVSSTVAGKLPIEIEVEPLGRNEVLTFELESGRLARHPL